MIVIKRTVPLDEDMIVTEPLKGSAFTLENGAHQFEITCTRNGEAVTLTGTVSGKFIRADGSTKLCGGTISSGKAVVTLSQDCYNVPGRFKLSVLNTTSSDTSVIYSCVGEVQRSQEGTVTDTGTVVPTPEQLAQAIADCGTATTAATNAGAFVPNMIAPAFDASVANSAGDYVTYTDGKLYRIIIDRDANVTWANTTKVEVKAGSAITQEHEALARSGEAYENASEAYTGDRWLEFRRGRYSSNLSNGAFFADSANYVSAFCPCQKGNKFLVDVYGGTGINRAYVVYDSSYSPLASAGASVHLTGTFTVETNNAAYIAFNNSLTNQATGYYAIKCSSTLVQKLSAKQDTLTFDSVPTASSDNPVKSGGVYSAVSAVDGKASALETAIGGYEVQIPVGGETGYYWNAETSTAVKTSYSSYKAYAPVACNPGEKYKVTGRDMNSSKQYLVLVVDDEYTILAHYGEHSNSGKTYEFVVPNDGAYILMTTGKGYTAKCYLEKLNSIPNGVFGGLFHFEGANIAIIGDSISTNGNWSESNPLGNVPEIVVEEADVGVELSAYVTYYDIGTTIGGHTIVESDVGTELTFTPVEADVGKIIGKPLNNNSESVVTWWEVARDTLGFNVIPVCWSGSSITDHEINTQESGHYIYKCSNAFHPSQIRKCGIRTPGTMNRTAPDMVIIYRGTNDFSHSPYARLNYDLTAYQPSGYPTEDTYSDGGTTRYDYVAGMLMTIKAVRDAYPTAKIALCTLNYFKRLSSNLPGFPTRNGQNTLEQYNNAIRAIADYANCDLIDFAKDGITAWNAGDGYYDTVNNPTHPTTKGHKVMGNRAIRDMMNFNGMT